MIIGDLNAYKREDAIRRLLAAGYTDLIERFEGNDAYSFLFSSQIGYLDHALANDALLPQVTGVTEWHINADEIPLFDYNDDVMDAAEQFFEPRKSTVGPLYEPNALRSSDHDPVLLGLRLRSPCTITPDLERHACLTINGEVKKVYVCVAQQNPQTGSIISQLTYCMSVDRSFRYDRLPSYCGYCRFQGPADAPGRFPQLSSRLKNRLGDPSDNHDE